MSQPCFFRIRIFFARLSVSSVAKLMLLAALLPVTAQADIISPFGGKPPQRPIPLPLIFAKGGKILDEIHKAGFDCVGLDDVVEQAQPGVDPATYAAQHLMPLKVTCRNGKHFFVTLPLGSADSGGAVLPLD